ncbi:MAG: DUF5686 family protein [Bacteroidia bacterium]
MCRFVNIKKQVKIQRFYTEFFVLVGILLLSLPIGAQTTTIRGKLIDASNSQSLPFVTVLIKNTQKGTLTDIDGKFELTFPDSIKNPALMVSYISYQPKTVLLSEFPDPQKIIIKLKAQGIALNEVVVAAGENPAHRIIRTATKNKDKNNPEKMHSFSYNSYNKCFVTADLSANIDSVSAEDTTLSGLAKFFKKQHLFLMESVTKRDFLHPDRNHETVMASRVSGFKNSPFAMIATQMQSFSFYDDFINVVDEKYLNPLSEGSTRKYFFALEDTLYDGIDSVYVISFKHRKNKNFMALKGVLYINTNGYAVQNVIAEPDRPDDYALSIKVQQKYQFIDGKQWFPVQLNTDWVWKNASIASKKDPTQKANMKAVSRSYVKDIILNPELKKREFNEVEVDVDKRSDVRDDAFWNAYRGDTLSAKERRTYKTIDSVGKAENLEKKFMMLEAILTNKLPVGIFDLNLDKILKANDYEKIRLGIGLHTNQKLSKVFTVGGYAGYGFGDKAFKYGGDLSVILWRKKELAFNALYENDLVESGGTRFFENTRTLASSELYRDIYVSVFDHIQKYQTSFSFRFLKYLRANVFVNHQMRYGQSLYGTTAKDGTTTLRDTFNFNEAGVQLKFLYREKFIQTLRSKLSLGSDFPLVFVNVTKGLNQTYFDQKGEFDYWKIDVKIEAAKTYKTIGTTRVQLAGGQVIGSAPYTMLYNNRGSLYGKFNVSAANTFETMGLNEFASDQYAALFLNHNIGRFLKFRKKFNPELELVHSMGVGSISNPLSIYNVSVSGMEKGYFESGLRLLHLYKSGFSTLGIGAFYRYGPYAKPDPADNLAIKLVLSLKL